MRARLRETAISAAVRGLPSEKVTPLRGDKGPLEAVGRHGGGGAERLLGLKLPVQGKQPLIQQAPPRARLVRLEPVMGWNPASG